MHLRARRSRTPSKLSGSLRVLPQSLYQTGHFYRRAFFAVFLYTLCACGARFARAAELASLASSDRIDPLVTHNHQPSQENSFTLLTELTLAVLPLYWFFVVLENSRATACPSFEGRAQRSCRSPALDGEIVACYLITFTFIKYCTMSALRLEKWSDVMSCCDHFYKSESALNHAHTHSKGPFVVEAQLFQTAETAFV